MLSCYRNYIKHLIDLILFVPCTVITISYIYTPKNAHAMCKILRVICTHKLSRVFRQVFAIIGEKMSQKEFIHTYKYIKLILYNINQLMHWIKYTSVPKHVEAFIITHKRILFSAWVTWCNDRNKVYGMSNIKFAPIQATKACESGGIFFFFFFHGVTARGGPNLLLFGISSRRFPGR
jgi:hypothetical protein